MNIENVIGISSSIIVIVIAVYGLIVDIINFKELAEKREFNAFIKQYTNVFILALQKAIIDSQSDIDEYSNKVMYGIHMAAYAHKYLEQSMEELHITDHKLSSIILDASKDTLVVNYLNKVYHKNSIEVFNILASGIILAHSNIIPNKVVRNAAKKRDMT